MVDLLRLGEDRRQRPVPPPAVHRARLTDGFATQRRRPQCAGDPSLRRPNVRQFLLAAAAQFFAAKLEREAAQRAPRCIFRFRCCLRCLLRGRCLIRPVVGVTNNARPRNWRGGAPADMADGGNLRAQRSHPFRVGLRVPSDGPAALGFLLLARSGGGPELVLALPGRRQPYRDAAFRGRLARTCRGVAYFRVPLALRVVLRPDEGVDLALLALFPRRGLDDRRRRRLRRRAGGEARGLLRVKVAAPPSSAPLLRP